MHFIILSLKKKKILFACTLLFTRFPPLLLYIIVTARGHHHPTLFFWWGQTALASADITCSYTSDIRQLPQKSNSCNTCKQSLMCKHCWFPFKAYIKYISGQLDEYCSFCTSDTKPLVTSLVMNWMAYCMLNFAVLHKWTRVWCWSKI